MELDDKRMEYQLVAKIPGLPPQVRTLPKNEDFSIKYKLDIGWKAIQMKLAQGIEEVGHPAHWKTIQDMESLYVVKTFPPPSDLERLLTRECVTIFNLSPPNKLSSAKFLVCFNFQSASMSLKVGENVSAKQF